MKNYEKPVVLMNEGVSEGVFAASGDGASSTDCWTVTAKSVQDWAGADGHVFEVHASHSKDVTHITTQVTYVLTFSSNLTSARSEFDCTFSGNTVTVVRDRHANGYYSGDEVTFKVWAAAGSEAETKALSCTGVTYTCRHETNVQGGID